MTVRGSQQSLSSPLEKGVALAIVVWFLAAMSLLVAGIVLQARVDIKLAQVHATEAKVEAAADGAMQLALVELRLLESQGELVAGSSHVSRQRLGGYDIVVSFIPLSGLIDLNEAGVELLQLLLVQVKDIDEVAAEELAMRVVDWRSEAMDREDAVGQGATATGSDSTGQAGEVDIRPGRFEAIEDLLLVPGIDRRIFESVRDSIFVSHSGHTGVDWLTAPPSVLQALGGLSEEDAVGIALDRSESGAAEAAPSAISLDFQQVAVLPTYRVDALVPVEGKVYLRRRWVDRASPAIDGLPWRFFRTEPVVVEASLAARQLMAREPDNG